MKAKIFLTGLALVSVFALTSAQGPAKGNGTGNCDGTAKCSTFVDANKNGICDTYENRTTSGTCKKGKGNGIGKANGTGNKSGKGQGNGTCKQN